MRERMLERVKEVLAPTDEEWKVLEPKIGKVQELSLQASIRGGMAFMRGRRGDRPQPPEEAPELTGVEKAVEQLRTALDSEEAKPEELKEKLTALREAREKSKQELAEAQQALRELVTLRQEAQLVLMGLLD